MNITTRKTMYIVLILLLSWQVSGADTLRINLIYKHRLDAAGRTQGYSTVRQQFFTPEQVLFREIAYDEQTSHITTYTFFFHEGNRLSSAETYNAKDSLLWILKYRYDVSGKKTGIDSLITSGNSLVSAGSRNFIYNAGGRIVKTKEFVAGKPAGTVQYSYDGAGNLIRVSKKFKPVSGRKVKSETLVYMYNSVPRIVEVAVSGKTMQKGTFLNKLTCGYTDNGQLATVNCTGTDYSSGLVKTYRYLPSGALSLYQETDAAGKFSLLLQYDYKKHFMDRGTQISRLGQQPK
jgi:YD repeat-containing protein